MSLDDATQRPCSISRFKPLIGKPVFRFIAQFNHHILFTQRLIDLGYFNIHDFQDILVGQRPEDDDIVNPVQNSGLKVRFNSSRMLSFILSKPRPVSTFWKPRDVPFSIARAARFEVMMMMVFLKSMLRP